MGIGESFLVEPGGDPAHLIGGVQRACELASKEVKLLLLKAHRKLAAAWAFALERIDDQAQAFLAAEAALVAILPRLA